MVDFDENAEKHQKMHVKRRFFESIDSTTFVDF